MADRVIFVCTLILAGAYFYATEQLPSLEIGDPLGPKAFPRLLGIALLITAFVLLFEIIKRKPAPPKVTAGATPEVRAAPVVIGAVAVWTLLYFIAYERLGFIIATTIYLLVLMGYFNRGKWVANVMTSVLFPIISYFMFTKALGVNLPAGILQF